jgi:hypothetical protein
MTARLSTWPLAPPGHPQVCVCACMCACCISTVRSSSETLHMLAGSLVLGQNQECYGGATLCSCSVAASFPKEYKQHA